jgi:hypothetical protein
MSKSTRIPASVAQDLWTDDHKCAAALDAWAQSALSRGIVHGDLTQSDLNLIDVLKARLSHHEIQMVEIESDFDRNEGDVP